MKLQKMVLNESLRTGKINRSIDVTLKKLGKNMPYFSRSLAF